jgi:hypothetical protein
VSTIQSVGRLRGRLKGRFDSALLGIFIKGYENKDVFVRGWN